MMTTIPAFIGTTSGRNQSALVNETDSIQFPGIAPRGDMPPMKTRPSGSMTTSLLTIFLQINVFTQPRPGADNHEMKKSPLM